MTNIDPALVKQVFDFSERERKSDIHQHAKLDDLRLRFEVAEGVLAHFPRLTDLPGRLKPGSAYNAPLAAHRLEGAWYNRCVCISVLDPFSKAAGAKKIDFTLANFFGVMSILIGFVCMLLAGFLLAVPTSRKEPNWFLAGFLILTAIELSVWLWSDTSIASSWVRDLWFALGKLQMPAFFFFFLSRCYSDFRLKRHDALHLVPFVLTLVVSFVGGPFLVHDVIVGTFTPGTAASVARSHIIYYGYLAAILVILWRFRRRFRRHHSGGRSEVLIWLTQLAAASLFAHTLVLIRDTISFTSGGTVVLALQMVGAILALTITTWIALKSLLQPELFRDVDRRLLRFDTTPDALSEMELSRVLQFVDAKKPYLDSDLSLSDLADQVALTPRELSALLNRSLGLHFFDFVNGRRVEHAKALLLATPKLSVMQVSQDSGFNSKSSFNTAFKKHAELTPSAFRAQKG